MLEKKSTNTENCNTMPLMTNKCAAQPDVSRFPFTAHSNSRPINLVFKNLCYSIGNNKSVLNNVSGMVKPGEMLAIMGPSGSGKTSLLNVLSGRVKCKSGRVTLNGKDLTKQLRRKICYVLQQDIFFTDLTVKQTLMYSAELRLPEKMPYSSKVEQVEHIIDVLELNQCQNTIIGDVMNRGLSGGEKKRTNIASELLTNPTVMLLDEPTSGLDSSTASSLLQNLKSFAVAEEKSLVVTIHQPSSQMFYTFDKLLLLCNGQVAYFGDVYNVVEHFSKIGLEIAPHYNPADFIIEQVKRQEIQNKIFSAAMEQRKEVTYPPEINENYNYVKGYVENFNCDNQSKTGKTYSDYKEMNEKEVDIPEMSSSCNGEVCSKQVELRIMMDPQENVSSVFSKIAKRGSDSGRSSWSDFPECSSIGSNNTDVPKDLKWPTSFYTQFKVLAKRNILDSKGKMLSKLNFIQAFGLAIVSGVIWFRVERTESRLEDIMGWMFFGMTYWMLFALFGALMSFPPEREIINKERASGAYRLSAYYLAKMAGELPLVIIMPTIYHFISYIMLGFNNAATCLSIWGVILLNTIVAQSVGLFIGVACTDFQLSVTISSLFTLSTMLFGGFYSGSMPYWIQWLQYFSVVHYAFNIMQIIEFKYGDPISCSIENSKFAACIAGNSTNIPVEDILSLKGPSHDVWTNIFVLLAFFVVFRGVGYIVLRYFRKPH